MSQQPPPIPDLSLDLINDALEYHSHSIVFGCIGNDFEEHWLSLRYFWKISDHQQARHGRIFHRARLAELVYYGCHLSPYDAEEDDAMVNWSTREWDALHKKLIRLVHSCKRVDANQMGGPALQGDHPRAKDKELFGKPIRKLIDHILINRHLSIFRPEMEQWIVSHKGRRDTGSRNRKQPHVSSRQLKQFWDEVEDIEDGKKHDFLKQFLTRSSTADRLVLAPMDFLAEILQEKPCNLESLQADLLKVIINWYRALFYEGGPALTRLGYGNLELEVAMGANEEHDNRNRKPAAVEDLRQARAQLDPSAHDPLPEVYEAAAQSVRANLLEEDEVKQEEEEEEAAQSQRQSLGSSRARQPSRQGEEDGESDATTLSDLRKQKAQRKKRSSEEHHVAAVRANNDGDDEASEITEPTPGSSQKKRRQREKEQAHNRRHEEEQEEDEEAESPRRRQKRRPEEDEEEEVSRPPVREESHSPRSRSSSQQIRRDKRRREQDSAKKKRGVRLKFHDSDEDDDEVKSVRLSELPKFRKNKPAPQKGGPRKRKFFSQEEKKAIKDGVRRFGHGKWIEILNKYPRVLGDRTNIQIKDCYRTMEKNGELDDE